MQEEREGLDRAAVVKFLSRRIKNLKMRARCRHIDLSQSLKLIKTTSQKHGRRRTHQGRYRNRVSWSKPNNSDEIPASTAEKETEGEQEEGSLQGPTQTNCEEEAGPTHTNRAEEAGPTHTNRAEEAGPTQEPLRGPTQTSRGS